MLFGIGSRNPVKVAAVRAGLAPFYPDALVEAVEAASGVAAQPVGDTETQQGAVNRARAVLVQLPEAWCGAGLEGGVAELGGVMYAFAWCAILHRDGRLGLASTGRR